MKISVFNLTFASFGRILLTDDSPALSGLGSLYGCLFFCREVSMKPRSIVYIDGFNFYYGAVRGTQYKWLDMEKCFMRLRPGDDIRRIWYFTALVDGAKGLRQQTYLRALATRPLVQVNLGKFKLKQVKCGVTLCTYPGSRIFDIPEEKRTDVNIALQLLDDAIMELMNKKIISPGDAVMNFNLGEQTRKILTTLTPREEKVLRMRFGIGEKSDHTLEEVGRDFNVTRERIRQIEAKALRKLRHPSRSKKLRSFLEQ